MHHSKKRRKKSKIFSKKTMILYGGLAVVCLIITVTITFILPYFTREVSDFAQGTIKSSMANEAERVLGRKLTESDRDRIEKKMGINISSVVNSGDKNIKDTDLAKKIEMHYQGKSDPADIEKAGKALREH